MPRKRRKVRRTDTPRTGGSEPHDQTKQHETIHGAAMSIKVMLAFSNKIFSEGIGMVLAVEKDLRVVEVMTPGVEYAPEMWQSINHDVVLTDFTSLYNSFPELKTAKKLPFILLDTGCGKENIVSAILKKKGRGVLLSDSDSALLVKAIRAVAKGDIWI